MPSRPHTRSVNSNPRAAASRSWRASLIRKRAQAVLGLGTAVVTRVCVATMAMQITPMISIATT